MLFSWSSSNNGSTSKADNLVSSIQYPPKSSRRRNCLAHCDRMKKKSVSIIGKVPENRWIQQVEDGLQKLANSISLLPNPSFKPSLPPNQSTIKQPVQPVQPVQPTQPIPPKLLPPQNTPTFS